MRINKETLTRIIKEEIHRVLNETMIRPRLPDGITDKQLANLKKLTYSDDPGERKQAKELFLALGYEGMHDNYFLDMEEYDFVNKPERFRDEQSHLNSVLYDNPHLERDLTLQMRRASNKFDNDTKAYLDRNYPEPGEERTAADVDVFLRSRLGDDEEQ